MIMGIKVSFLHILKVILEILIAFSANVIYNGKKKLWYTFHGADVFFF